MQPHMVTPLVKYDPKLEEAVTQIVRLLRDDYGLSKRAIALLLLQGDEEIMALVEEREGGETAALIRQIVNEVKFGGERDPLYRITTIRQRFSEYIASKVIEEVEAKPTASDWLNDFLIHPFWGTMFLMVLLYFGFYQFVGVFAAGTLVELLEDKIFGNYILPPIEKFFNWLIPWTWLRDLFVSEYGVFTLGIRYAIALLLPIVAAFFFVFSLVEDSGYFPRLALLVDRLFKRIGLSGRAVIPMVLGFGCDTMATLVTRILETRRERIIATLLLALAIPCSAQLGVVMVTVSKVKGGILVWAIFVFAVFLLVGYLTTRLLPGEQPRFFIEVVPLRMPRLDNVLVKTWTRLQWYLLEITPLFILASTLIWLGRITHIFDLVIAVLSYPIQWVGLPKEISTVILFGFFRRDYGAAGLLDMVEKGAIGGIDLVTTAIILTLFVPCIAQFLVMVREHGWRTAAAISGFILPFAFLCGFVARQLLLLLSQLGLVT